MIAPSQPQLLQMALNAGDVIYTPDWVAYDMVNFFRPIGAILEPCSGDGAFLRYLPEDTQWCEIEKGKDFFSWDIHIDWCIGNPPYSMFSKWLDHSMEIADDICYLIPANKAFNSCAMIERVMKWGGFKSIRVYGTGAQMGFPIGYAIAAVHYQRGYMGATTITMYAAPATSDSADAQKG